MPRQNKRWRWIRTAEASGANPHTLFIIGRKQYGLITPEFDCYFLGAHYGRAADFYAAKHRISSLFIHRYLLLKKIRRLFYKNS